VGGSGPRPPRASRCGHRRARRLGRGSGRARRRASRRNGTATRYALRTLRRPLPRGPRRRRGHGPGAHRRLPAGADRHALRLLLARPPRPAAAARKPPGPPRLPPARRLGLHPANPAGTPARVPWKDAPGTPAWRTSPWRAPSRQPSISWRSAEPQPVEKPRVERRVGAGPAPPRGVPGQHRGRGDDGSHAARAQGKPAGCAPQAHGEPGQEQGRLAPAMGG
jgi:hypothetical protein